MLGFAVGLVSALLAAAPPASTADVSQDPETRLAARGYLKPSERATLDAGGFVAKVIDIVERSELRNLVVVRTTASPAEFMRCVRDPQCFRRAGDFLGAGTISTPPSPRDFDAVAFDEKELRSLARCRVGDCDVRMTAEDIGRFRSGVDWNAPDRQAKANGLLREMLLRYASAYIERGNAALPTYGDAKAPVSANDSLKILLGRDAPVAEPAPEIRRCLETPPAVACPGIDRSLAWYKEKVWKQTIIGLNDVAVADRSASGVDRVFIGSKMIFATNYYNASLEYGEYYRRAGGDRATFVYMSDARLDAGADGFGAIERFLLRRLLTPRLRTWARSLEGSLKMAGRPGESPRTSRDAQSSPAP
jgi:hypothetical protein